MQILRPKNLRKESRVQRLEQQLGVMTHIAREYEKTLVKIAQYADRFAHGSNPAKDILITINRQLRG